MTDPALWTRLLEFELDEEGVALPFTKRLARDQGWSWAFAKEVVFEYKRFLYLAMVAGHSVTPSEEVDEAWHLHLCYTRSYWGDLCGRVLGRDLHHGPTKGGTEQAEHFYGQYERTLASYASEFGEAAPEAVWPAAKIRFGGVRRRGVANTGGYYLLPKVWVKRGVGALAAVLAGGLAIGCRETFFDNRGHLKDEVFFGLIVGVVIVIVVFKAIKGGGGGSGCSACSSGGGGGGCSGGDSGCSSGCGGGCGGCGD